MVQEILMWISVFGAFSYTAFAFIRIIYKSFQEKENGCNSAGCCGCSAKTDLLKHIKTKKLTYVVPKN